MSDRRLASQLEAGRPGGSRPVDTVALIHVVQRKILLTRSRGRVAFYMPGGKRKEGEADIEALAREVSEELGTTLMPGTERYYGTFEDQAYGEPEGVRVRIACYQAELHSSPRACAEIEDIGYFTSDDYRAMDETAPAVHAILTDLASHDRID